MLEIYNEFASSTGGLMKDVMTQIQKDVSKLRSRIETRFEAFFSKREILQAR